MKENKKYLAISSFLALAIIAVGWYVFQHRNYFTFIGSEIIYVKKIGLSLAFIAGLASFFSPCSFPLLPAYMGYYLTLNTDSGNPGNSVAKAVYFGTLAASGIFLFYAISAMLLYLFGKSMQNLLSALNPFIGIIIAILGISLIKGKSFSLPIIGDVIGYMQPQGNKSAEKSIFLFGFFYGIAASGCTGIVFLGVVLASLLKGAGFAMLSVISYSLGMSSLMIASTLLAGISKESILREIQKRSMLINKLSGYALLIAGVSLIYIYFSSLMGVMR